MEVNQIYIPILKWKGAEKGMLKTLKGETKRNIIPFVQFVMPSADRPAEGEPKKSDEQQFIEMVDKFDKKLPDIPKEISDFWGENSIFVDFSLIFTTELKKKSYKHIINTGYELGLNLIPTVSLSDELEIKETACLLLEKSKERLCLRLSCADLNNLEQLKKDIEEFVEKFSLKKENMYLLVDIQEINGNDAKFDKYINLSQKMHDIKDWGAFIFASGAFPKDLSEFKMEDENLSPRTDWIKWLEHVRSKKLIRIPLFADYTIQYPVYLPQTQLFHPTTSIKYTLDNDWYIMKGKKQKYKLYLANANLLLKSDKFFGEDFSFGDAFIAGKGRHFIKYMKNPALKGTGNTEQWIRACISHHIECTVDQIANLS